MAPPLASTLSRTLVLLALASGGSRAWGDDLSAQVRPGVSLAGSDSTDETGRTTTVRSTAYQQRNQLMLDKSLFPLLNFSAGGYYDFGYGTLDNDGLLTRFNPQSWDARAQLTWGIPLLNASVAYDRREGFTDIQSAQRRITSTNPVLESISGRAAWRPLDLPTVDFTISRNRLFDTARQVQNLTVDSAALAFSYRPERRFELTHRIAWSHPYDHLHGVETTDLSNAFAANWGDNFWNNRVVVFASYAAGTRSTNIVRASVGGTIEKGRFPILGLSVIETAELTPERIILNRNPALIDGNVNASAGLNIGFGPSADNDTLGREMGGRFLVPPEGPVNTIYAWVSKALPADVSGAFTWEAFTSTDNLNWKPLRIVGPVQFSLFSNRFEITTELTDAEYVKVVTHPLPVAITSDETYREIQVTDLQFLEIVPVEAERKSPLQIYGNLNATVRVELLKTASSLMSWDTAFFLAHASDPARVSWSVLNGVSFNRKLNRVFAVTARVDRSDSDEGTGHHGLERWGATLSADPLPALRAAVTYGGQLTEPRPGLGGLGLTQSVGAYVRANLYPGVSAFANVNTGGGLSEVGQRSQNTSASASLGLVPSKVVTVNFAFSYGKTSATGGGPDVSIERTMAEVNASVTPFRALALYGSVSRQWFSGMPPATLANFSGAFSPFQQGDLQVRYAYQETINTSGDVRTRTHGPALRWNIRPGWHLDGGYNRFESTSPTLRSGSYAFFASLVLALR